MAPGEWKMVPDNGQNIRESLVPMTFPGADAVLFQMLGVLIDSGEKLASTQAIMSGDDGGKNMQPTTVMALIDQGMQVFTAVYKRVFRSLKAEFRMLAAINAQTVSPEEYNAFHDEDQQYDPAQEYAAIGMDVQPVADPNTVIKMAERAKAQIIMQLAEMGMVDMQAALPRITDAMGIENAEELLPQPDPAQQQMQMQMMQMQMASAQADLVAKQVAIQKTMAEVEETQAHTMERLASAQTQAAQVPLQQQAQALEAMKALLDDENKRLATVLQGLGRMEGASRNGASSRADGQGNRGREASPVGALLGGQSPPGIPPNGGIGGGGLV
jgi:chaperonin GroES